MHIVEFCEWLPDNEIKPLDNFPSCNALYNRAVFLAAGGFLEDVFPMEEVVLNHVLCSQGRRLLFNSTCAVRHFPSRTSWEMLRHQHRLGIAYRFAADKYGLPSRFLSQLPRAAVLPGVLLGRFTQILGRLLSRHPVFAILCVCLATFVWVHLGAWALGYLGVRGRID
jgi:hypothetical protein